MVVHRTAAAAAPVVKWLGYGGLIPFIAFAVLTWTDHERWALWNQSLLAYGAVILSFVGALHWGVAMAPGTMSTRERNALFAWSVVPSLMAFAALVAPAAFGDILLVVGFLLHYGMDLRMATRAAMPEWYLPLRWRLSVTAMLCLIVGAIARVAG